MWTIVDLIKHEFIIFDWIKHELIMFDFIKHEHLMFDFIKHELIMFDFFFFQGLPQQHTVVSVSELNVISHKYH